MAKELKVNHNTAQKWRKTYDEKGLDGLLHYGKIGFKPSKMTPEMHKAIEARLYSPKDAFTSYTRLIDWLIGDYIPTGINYHTVNKYVKRHFGAKL